MYTTNYFLQYTTKIIITLEATQDVIKYKNIIKKRQDKKFNIPKSCNFKIATRLLAIQVVGLRTIGYFQTYELLQQEDFGIISLLSIHSAAMAVLLPNQF